jgi:TldD protein
MKTRLLGALLLLLVAVTQLPAVAAENTEAQKDPVLRAMLEELHRSQSRLKLDNVATPYYIEYRIVELDEYSAEAAFGSLRRENRIQSRILRVVVRVGDYKQDSSIGRGEGLTNVAPLDNDNLALRHALWLATDRAYKQATENFTQKQAQLKQLTIEHPLDDFARVPAVERLAATARLEAPTAPYRDLLLEATALYRRHPKLESVEGRLRFQAVSRYLVTSEGAIVRDGRNSYQLNCGGSTQAEDGMRLERGIQELTSNAKELPAREAWLKRMADMLDSLEQMRIAPLADEEYRGPVLFRPSAAADVVSTLVGRNVLGQRPELGKPARTTGEWSAEYKSRVLPPFLTVKDDPALNSFGGHALLGGYAVDDEGVAGQPITLVDQGRLVSYLTSRQPIRDFPDSNGHGRALPFSWPEAAYSTLVVSATETLSPAELKNKLIEICREKELAYGYIVETLGVRLRPRLLYRVWAKDGREELVRGAVFGELDTRALRSDLLAAGNDATADNSADPVPQSVIVPSLLFEELQVKRANDSKDKLPEYPAPALSSAN